MQFSVGVFGLPPAGIGACCAPCGNGLPCVGPRYVPSNRAIGEVPVNTYTVQRSDSLSLITWRFGQPANETTTLYSVNSGLIGPDPHKLEIGWILTLPYGWPATPSKKDRPTRAWINEAAVALKEVGFTAKPNGAKSEPDKTSPPPPTPPQLKPDDGGTGGKVLLGVGAVVAVGIGAWLTRGYLWGET